MSLIKDKQTHVCMIAYTIYPSDARVRREAETIAAQPGFQVTFLTLKERSKPNTYRMQGVNIQELNISKYQGKNRKQYIVSYLKYLAASFMAINRLLLSGGLDIIHVHNMPNFLVLAALFPRLLGKMVILDIHDTTPETYFAKFSDSPFNRIVYKLLCGEESLCCRLAHHIVCVNHVQKDALVSRGISPDKILVSLNVPDPRIFNRKVARNPTGGNRNHFNLVYHGTLTKRLGIDLAIMALSILKKDIPQAHLYVLGKGDDMDEFIKLSKVAGVEEKVHFNKTMVPVEEMVELIRDMDVGVISNRQNAATELMLPVKMLEYMALDIPVVAPKLQAIHYYFDEHMIRYYEPGDVNSLADAIRHLYDQKERRKPQIEAARKFYDVYGWERHKQGLIHLYKELTY